MEASTLRKLAVICDREEKFLFIEYSGTWRNVYPLSIRDDRLFAWCELHPGKPMESFNLSQIAQARVSVDDSYFTPRFTTDFEGAEAEEL